MLADITAAFEGSTTRPTRVADGVWAVAKAALVVTVFGAAAVANGGVFAGLTFGMGDRLFGGELVAALAPGDLGPGVDVDIAELPLALDEEVAGVDVAVELDYGVAIATLVQ